jgi:hypothetical protein
MTENRVRLWVEDLRVILGSDDLEARVEAFKRATTRTNLEGIEDAEGMLRSIASGLENPDSARLTLMLADSLRKLRA